MIKKLLRLWDFINHKKNNDNNLGLYEKAIATHSAGQFDEAQQQYEIVLQHDPHHAGALAMLGTIALQRNHAETALEYIEKSLKINENQPETYCNQGFALAALQRWDAALISYERAIALKPDFAEAYNNHGNVLRALKRFHDARLSYQQAIALSPDFAMAHNSYGTVLKELNQPEQALLSYDRAIALAPDYVEAYYNKALVLHEAHELNQMQEALVYYNKAIALNPQYMDAHWSKALLLILYGYYQEGWEIYECRRYRPEMQSNYPPYTQPLWLGQESLVGKTILVYAEQGLGDTIQFCRYISMLETRGAKVLLRVHPPLITLLATLQCNAHLIQPDERLPHFDFQCPLMSLPRAFQTTLENIPAAPSYLSVDAAKRTIWHNLLGVKNKFRVGLVWSGAEKHLDDVNRSLPLAQLMPILELSLKLPLEFHSLQKEIRSADQNTLDKIPSIQFIQSHHTLLHDFSDTAALVAQMDIIISVDTSVAHLAAALGKKVFILLPYFPDYRWMLHRSDSPWYPTVTLLRQTKKGDWSTVIHDIQNILKNNC